MITALHITKHYGRSAVLQGLSFEANPGQVTLLIGSNGAGKTTTLKILSGLSRPDAGDAWVLGESIVRKREAAQRYLSFLPQGVAFHPRLTCRDILRFYARLRGCGRNTVDKVLEIAGLQSEAKKKTGVLSGGLRQRLGLAVLLLPDAPVLLLDEPGLSLDPEWRSRLQMILQEEAERGKTVVVTTHLLGEWEGVADRCLLCQDGQVTSEVDPCNLRSQFPIRPDLVCAL